MDIRSITHGLAPSEAASAKRADEAERADKSADAGAARSLQDAAEADELRLSKGPATAREATGEMSLARAALDNAPGLSEERRTEILGRIRSGYYSDPSVTAQVAERMADSLKGGRSA